MPERGFVHRARRCIAFESGSTQVPPVGSSQVTMVCGSVRNVEETTMSQTKTFHEQRCALRERSGATFVQRDEFCKLLLSLRRMVRSDEPAVHLRGLLDLETGKRFLIEQEKLFEQ
jgi:hypothetical protein